MKKKELNAGLDQIEYYLIRGLFQLQGLQESNPRKETTITFNTFNRSWRELRELKRELIESGMLDPETQDDDLF